ncbi:AMIN-like domain-containing (lipo)protein [Yinghuangia soli]|uniref:AMIN-like domain-containing protein n=1 Tax=Yinghuangia soli TaxID=2908204 RepID=A0AA41PV80_9ACTN|nr:hypothetical protein [Yinghuangia soli]MCF2526331.1 hypothetical protein [Yinghuangia soli]
MSQTGTTTPALPRRRPRITRTARTSIATGAAGVLLALAFVPVTAAQAAAPVGVLRTSVPAAAPMTGCNEPVPAATYLTNIRTGRHPSFDRIVLDFSGRVPAYGSTGGPDQLVYCGSGQTVPLTGTKYTQIESTDAAAHDESGNPTYTGPRLVYTPHLAKVTGFAVTCDFEGHLNVGFATKSGVREIRTTTLTNPSRIVIDVRWA